MRAVCGEGKSLSGNGPLDGAQALPVSYRAVTVQLR